MVDRGVTAPGRRLRGAGRSRAGRAGPAVHHTGSRRAGHLSDSHDLPTAGPGAPTPPIVLAGGGAAATSHLDSARVEVPAALLERLRGICEVADDEIGRASCRERVCPYV